MSGWLRLDPASLVTPVTKSAASKWSVQASMADAIEYRQSDSQPEVREFKSRLLLYSQILFLHVCLNVLELSRKFYSPGDSSYFLSI
jgi:hypothetical protein